MIPVTTHYDEYKDPPKLIEQNTQLSIPLMWNQNKNRADSLDNLAFDLRNKTTF